MNIVQKFSTHLTSVLVNRKIEYIAIHYTAGTTSQKGSAVNTAWYFAGSNAHGSADFIVDDETIVQYNPDIRNRFCAAVGDKRGNSKGGSLYKKATNANTISIEICSTNDTKQVLPANDKSWSFTPSALNKAAELTIYLMEQYNIPVDRVVRHYDISGKLCPGIIGWNADSGDESAWLEFKERLTDDMQKRYNTIAELPDWAKPAVQKLCWAGKLKGKTGNKDANGFPTDLDLSEDMIRLIVMLT